jgi:CLIP-associating protein 1/2
VLEYALIVLWEMLEHQSTLLEGDEADIFNALLTVRYCNKSNVSHSNCPLLSPTVTIAY